MRKFFLIFRELCSSNREAGREASESRWFVWVFVSCLPLLDVVGTAARTWHMLVDGDYHLEFRKRIVSLCPFGSSWCHWRDKTDGGHSIVWVGFDSLHTSRQSGSSHKRAEWVIRWIIDIASAPTVQAGERMLFFLVCAKDERCFCSPELRIPFHRNCKQLFFLFWGG